MSLDLRKYPIAKIVYWDEGAAYRSGGQKFIIYPEDFTVKALEIVEAYAEGPPSDKDLILAVTLLLNRPLVSSELPALEKNYTRPVRELAQVLLSKNKTAIINNSILAQALLVVKAIVAIHSTEKFKGWAQDRLDSLCTDQEEFLQELKKFQEQREAEKSWLRAIEKSHPRLVALCEAREKEAAEALLPLVNRIPAAKRKKGMVVWPFI